MEHETGFVSAVSAMSELCCGIKSLRCITWRKELQIFVLVLRAQVLILKISVNQPVTDSSDKGGWDQVRIYCLVRLGETCWGLKRQIEAVWCS
jgi:hypothetical protein